MKGLLIFFSIIWLITCIGDARAQDRVCHVLDSAINMNFSIENSDDFFNCLLLKKSGPTNDLKIVTISFGMEHNLNIYNSEGVLVQQLNATMSASDSAEFDNFSASSTKTIVLKPVSAGLKEIDVKVSYFLESSGKHILLVSTRVIEKLSIESPILLPPPITGCPPGEICFDPMSSHQFVNQNGNCDSSNTPPSSEEMGLGDEGINQYAKKMYELGQQSDGIVESMFFIYQHYTDPSQNPKALPGGSEHGGNFKYGVGLAAHFDGLGMNEIITDYLTFAGSAFQDSLQNQTEIVEDLWYFDELDWYYQIGVLNMASGHAVLLMENSQDQQSIQEAINYYREIYSTDPNNNNVKDSCSQEPLDSNPQPSNAGGVSSGFYFSVPNLWGGIIYARVLFGTICDPGSACYRDTPEDKENE